MTSLPPSSFTTSRTSCRRLIGAITGAGLLSVAAGDAFAQYTWTRNTAGTSDWSTASNWSGSTPPPASSDSLVRINNVTTTQTIRLTANQALNAGFTQSQRSTINFNLQGYTLTIAGAWAMGATTTDQLTGGIFSTYSNGTVQLGTETKAATINAFTGSDSAPASRSLVFAAGSTFDSVNLSELAIIKNPASANRNQVGTVNLSAATLKSGEENNTLKVNGAVIIASISALNSAGSTLNGKGSLLLPSSVAKVSMGSLLVGRNSSEGGMSGASVASYYNTDGTLDLGGGSAVDLHVDGNFTLGQGDYVSGSITNLPEVLNLSIGSAESNGRIWIGYKDSSHTNSTVKDHDNLGTLVSLGGTFKAYVTELRVGQNIRPGGTATGVLDMSAATLDELVISGAAMIGSGTNASGTVRLKEGTASSASLSVGTALGAPAERSLLELNDTTFSTANLTLGAFGDIDIIVGSSSSGLELSNSLLILDGGIINIDFTDYNDLSLWGIKITGDHQTLFNQYFDAGWFTASGEYSNLADVYFDGSYTYFGIAIPEPSSVLLLCGGLAAYGMICRKKSISA